MSKEGVALGVAGPAILEGKSASRGRSCKKHQWGQQVTNVNGHGWPFSYSRMVFEELEKHERHDRRSIATIATLALSHSNSGARALDVKVLHHHGRISACAMSSRRLLSETILGLSHIAPRCRVPMVRA